MPVFNAAAPGGDLASLLALRETQVIHKRTRWTIFALKPTDETTERMYDELWAVLGDEKRHLSVARNAGAMWAVLYKGDEKVAALAGISAHRAVYEIRKPLGGGAARNAVANFGRVWFASSSEHTSDFELSPDDEDVPMEARGGADGQTAPLSPRQREAEAASRTDPSREGARRGQVGDQRPQGDRQ